MSMNCITCGTAMPDISEFCPACGRALPRDEAVKLSAEATAGRDSTDPVPPPESRTTDSLDSSGEERSRPGPPVAWNDRLSAAAAYLTIIPAIVFLFLKPYAQRPFVRFHAGQSIIFWGLALILLGIGVLASTFGFLLIWLFTGTLVVLGLSLTWLVLSIKALQGEYFRLPGVGDVAERLLALA